MEKAPSGSPMKMSVVSAQSYGRSAGLGLPRKRTQPGWLLVTCKSGESGSSPPASAAGALHFASRPPKSGL